MGADSKRTQRQTLDSEMYVRCTSWHETLFSGGTYMKRLWSTISLITLAVVVLSPAGAVFAQSMNAGDIRGIVTDTTGAAVPGVIVSVVNKNTGVAKELVTNQDGLYDTSSIVADGASVTLPSSANADVMVLETVQEVKIGTSAFSAQYGVGGLMFNQISKGGTNSFHGAAYEYFQNNALNAASYSFGTGTIPV